MIEMLNLIVLLTEMNLPFRVIKQDGLWNPEGNYQVILLDEHGRKLDDAIWGKGSNGYALGLLETYVLHDCEGMETALEVAYGWHDMYYKTGRFAE